MTEHHRTHWIAVAAVASLALLAFEAAGQGSGAQAVFEGRPAMAGAQAGLGAMAGPPQGGIGLQGSEGAQVTLRRPDTATLGAGRALPPSRCEGPTLSAAQNPACLSPSEERLDGRLSRLGISDAQPR